MRQIIITCDRCGKEPPKRIDTGIAPMWRVSIGIAAVDEYFRYHKMQKEQEAEWCGKCVEEMGVRTPLLKADEQPAPITIEDIIREIVREEKDS